MDGFGHIPSLRARFLTPRRIFHIYRQTARRVPIFFTSLPAPFAKIGSLPLGPLTRRALHECPHCLPELFFRELVLCQEVVYQLFGIFRRGLFGQIFVNNGNLIL